MYKYHSPKIVRIKLVTDGDNLVFSKFSKVLNLLTGPQDIPNLNIRLIINYSD